MANRSAKYPHQQTQFRTLVTALMMACCLTLQMVVAAPPANCKAIAAEIKVLEDQRTSFQKNLQHAAPGQKAGLVSQINKLNNQIREKQGEFDNCLNSKPLVSQCSPPPDSYYKLPFGSETGWVLANGNWDDPTNAHNPGDPHGLQAFAFDFLRDVNNDGKGEAGQHILAARPGTVYDLESQQTGNSWEVTKIFFFRGGQYLRYDLSTAKVDPGFPKQIASNWSGWPSSWGAGVDAVVNWGNGKIFFFKGSEFLRFDFAANHVDAGFPKPIAGNWTGWPHSWNSGIDEAINWGNGKVYFFKGGEYLRFDIDADRVDAGYPQSIAGGNWKDWPAGWNSDLDVAVPWTYGRAIFFKGNQSMMVEMATHKAMGPPGSNAVNFPNFPSSWSKVDAALIWSHDGYLGVGNYVVIDHGDGSFATYWHLSRNGLKVKVGDKVERGDWLAVSGSTGNSSTPHFHFDVRTGWDKGYPANTHEYPSIKLRFQTYDHNCWIPKVGNQMVSNNY
jgi:matrix metalloproteinase-14 (membrane-inserted)